MYRQDVHGHQRATSRHHLRDPVELLKVWVLVMMEVGVMEVVVRRGRYASIHALCPQVCTTGCHGRVDVGVGRRVCSPELAGDKVSE